MQGTFPYLSPTLSLFGYGCRSTMGKMMQGMGFKKALVVTDKPLVDLGVVAMVTDALAENSIEFVIFDHVRPNPTIGNVENGLSVLKQEGCDVIVTVGGGSPHDCGKAIGILATNGGTVSDYIGANKSAKRSLPLVMVNTTAGTGSECTSAYVIVREETSEKFGIVDRNCLATIAVDDHELAMGLPSALTAGTGMDAITHAIECYTSIRSYTIPQELALGALRQCFRHLKNAVTKPDEESRAGMAAGSYLAGLAFGNTGCGMVHAMSHQLSAVYDLPHGLCNAVLLPWVMAFNATAPRGMAQYAEMARELFPLDCQGCDDAAQAQILIRKVEELSQAVGTRQPLSALGVRREDIGMLADKALVDGSMPNNVLQPTKEQVEAVFTQAL